jgi:hypothetical protein
MSAPTAIISRIQRVSDRRRRNPNATAATAMAMTIH